MTKQLGPSLELPRKQKLRTIGKTVNEESSSEAIWERGGQGDARRSHLRLCGLPGQGGFVLVVPVAGQVEHHLDVGGDLGDAVVARHDNLLRGINEASTAIFARTEEKS